MIFAPTPASPMPSAAHQPGVADAIAALAAAMRREGLRWYVFGAQAVLAYGRPRTTADVDATVALGSSSVDGLVATLAREGVELRTPDWKVLVDEARVLPLVHAASGLEVDVVLAGPGLEEEFLTRARSVDFAGVEAPAISPEDLVGP